MSNKSDQYFPTTVGVDLMLAQSRDLQEDSKLGAVAV